MIFVKIGGSVGEVSALALILGFVYLLIRRVIRPHITLVIVGTIALMTWIFNMINPDIYTGPLFNIFTGGVLLRAIFMATDYVTRDVRQGYGHIRFRHWCHYCAYPLFRSIS